MNWGKIKRRCEICRKLMVTAGPDEDKAAFAYVNIANHCLCACLDCVERNDLQKWRGGPELDESADDDSVNHPSHYTSGGIEVIDAIEAWGLDADFCLANAVKYIARAGKKNPNKFIEDLEKARWYLTRRIERLQGGTCKKAESK